MKELCRLNNPVARQLLQSLLRQEGIESVVFGENLGSVMPLGDLVAPQIMVAEDDFARAKALFESVKADLS